MSCSSLKLSSNDDLATAATTTTSNSSSISTLYDNSNNITTTTTLRATATTMSNHNDTITKKKKRRSLQQQPSFKRIKSTRVSAIRIKELNHEFVPKMYEKSLEDIEIIRASLKNNFIFRNVSNDVLEEQMIPAFEKITTYQKGDVIIQQGDNTSTYNSSNSNGNNSKDDCYFYILGGNGTSVLYEQQEIINNNNNNNNNGSSSATTTTTTTASVVVVGEATQPGESFGELALLYQSPRKVTVRANHTTMILYRVDAITFRYILQSRSKFYKTLARRAVTKVKTINRFLQLVNLKPNNIIRTTSSNNSDDDDDDDDDIHHSNRDDEDDDDSKVCGKYDDDEYDDDNHNHDHDDESVFDDSEYEYDDDDDDDHDNDHDNDHHHDKILSIIQQDKKLQRKKIQQHYDDDVFFYKDHDFCNSLKRLHKQRSMIRSTFLSCGGEGGGTDVEADVGATSTTTNICLDAFHRSSMLGEGQYGTVWLVRRPNNDNNDNNNNNNNKIAEMIHDESSFALKIQSKTQMTTTTTTTTTSRPRNEDNNNDDDSFVEYNTIEEGIRRECSILKQLCHPFIVNFIHHFEDVDNIYIIMGAITTGIELWDYIHQENQETGEWKSGFFRNNNNDNDNDNNAEYAAKFFALLIADTLHYMHKYHRICHRDIKPENIMVNEHGYPVIVDFGFAKQLGSGSSGGGGRSSSRSSRSRSSSSRLLSRSSSSSIYLDLDLMTFTLCGTPKYTAPEVIANEGHGCPVDYWALGVVIYEMISGENPFWDPYTKMSDLDLMDDILNEEPYPLKDDVPNCSDDVEDLVQRLLHKDPFRRLCGVDVLSHSWFDDIDIPKVRNMEKLQAPMLHVLKAKAKTNHWGWCHHHHSHHHYNNSRMVSLFASMVYVM